MSWPLKETFRDGNKGALALRRVEKLDRAIEVLTKILENPELDVAEADGIALSLSELHLRLERLQEKYFNGDGRSKRKNRKGEKEAKAMKNLLK